MPRLPLWLSKARYSPGAMPADASSNPANVATITFDVVVYPDAPDGTVISNQAFLSSPPYGIADQPSDDPRTAVVDDPTQDVVGNFPLLFAPKTAALQIDNGFTNVSSTMHVTDNGGVVELGSNGQLIPNHLAMAIFKAFLDEVDDTKAARQGKSGISQKNGNDVENEPVAFQDFICLGWFGGQQGRGRRGRRHGPRRERE